MADPNTAPLFATTPDYGDLALVLTGGGARGAYQVGVLRYLAKHHPELQIPIITGVSAGAVNAAHLAQHHGTFPQAVEELAELWGALHPEQIFHVNTPKLAANVLRWGTGLLSGGRGDTRVRGMVDTAPLNEFLNDALAPVDGELTGIDYNLERNSLRAIALITTSYTTGQTVIWVQGRQIREWERPNRRSVQARLTVNHVMASAALPLFFPAVQIGNHWYGDGGIGLTAPLSPALHLGAHKILVVSTWHPRTHEEADQPNVYGYPPPAQILGVLYHAVFLDLIDQDALRLERLNRLLEKLPEDEREGMRKVDLLVLRPSQDLGSIARDLELHLPRAFRFLTRGLGTQKTSSSDLLSMLMFQAEYARLLMEMGEADAEANAEEIAAFLSQ